MNTDNIEKTAAEGLHAGFTLIEILVAVAIIGILATGAVIGIPALLEGAKEDAAAQQVQTLKSGVAAFKLRYPGKRLTELRQLVEGDDDHPPIIEGGEDVLIDPWGNEYKLKTLGKSNYAVISFGEDGVEGTEDDINSAKVKSKAKEK